MKRKPPPPPHMQAWCEWHGKFGHNSRRAARAVIRRMPNRAGMREYRCTAADGWWHVGHLPKATVRGRLTVSEVYQ